MLVTVSEGFEREEVLKNSEKSAQIRLRPASDMLLICI